jgi:hypothetical protein
VTASTLPFAMRGATSLETGLMPSRVGAPTTNGLTVATVASPSYTSCAAKQMTALSSSSLIAAVAALEVEPLLREYGTSSLSG